MLDGAATAKNLDERIENICARDIELLRESRLISSENGLKATEFGHTMARYYITYKTMKTLLGLPSQAKISQIVGEVRREMVSANQNSYQHLYRLRNSTKLDSGVEKRVSIKLLTLQMA
jgi:replicative superfamily II helicase